MLVIAGSVAAFVAPPFTGLDTLPSLGVVLLRSACCSRTSPSSSVGLVVGVAGVMLEIVLGKAAVHQVWKLF